MSWTQRLHGDNALGLSDTDATLTRYSASRWQVGLDDVIEVAGVGRVRHRTALADAQPTVELGAGGWLLGAGGAAAPDVRGYRSGALEFTVDDGAAGQVSTKLLGTTLCSVWDAGPNTVLTALTLSRSVSGGVGAANVGVGAVFKTENDAGTLVEFGKIYAEVLSAAAAASTSRLVFAPKRSADVGSIPRFQMQELGFLPISDGFGALGINSIRFLGANFSNAVDIVPTSGGQPSARLVNKSIRFGQGGAAALTSGITEVSTGVMQADNGAGAAAALNVIGQLGTQGRNESYVSTAVTPYVVAATLENLYVDSTAGPMAVSIVSPVTYPGHVVRVTTTVITANQITVTPVAGLINGAATYVIPVGLSVVEFRSDGANWWASRSLIP